MKMQRLLAVCMLVTACGERDGEPRPETDPSALTCDDAAARVVVERFGTRMKNVSLLAPDSVVRRDMRAAYDALVTPDLLEAWLADAGSAPGRQVSSPWPDHIEVRSVEDIGGGECRVEGDIVYITSADTGAAAGVREHVVLSVSGSNGWRISRYDRTGPAGGSTPPGSGLPDNDIAGRPGDAGGAAAAVEVVEQYYAAINAKDLRRAYSLWSGSGAASGQSFDDFARGYAETSRVRVELGAPGRIEAAAGSRYVTVPVVITAETSAGARERFSGTYTLRRGVVDGATAEQRSWRIQSADIARR